MELSSWVTEAGTVPEVNELGPGESHLAPEVPVDDSYLSLPAPSWLAETRLRMVVKMVET